MFLPDNEKWCVSAVYNTSNEIVEWYFDMTKENSIDEQGIPYYDDLYLDIAISPDFRIVILDEDELREALELKEITQSDYDMAHHTCSKIIKDIIPNKDFLISFFKKYLVQLEH
jgi:predicted RNA-binding protein associated with RNAse of E/G family